jgi:hypothetical protein
MNNRTRKRLIDWRRKFPREFVFVRTAEELAWESMAPVGREFGSPDYERLTQLDYQAIRAAEIMAEAILGMDEIEYVRSTILASRLRQNSRWREESAIQFVCHAAEKRGNSYTRPQIIVLLKMGRTAAEKPFSDAEMLMRLHAAYEEILTSCSKEDAQ